MIRYCPKCQKRPLEPGMRTACSVCRMELVVGPNERSRR